MLSIPQSLKHPRTLLLLLSCVVFLSGLGIHELWPPDEPRFALIAEDMLQSGNYIVPHLQEQVYSEKPPLQIWLIVFFSLPSGHVTEWSARLPSALAAIGSVMLTWSLGCRLWSERAGWISALALMTSGLFFMRARWCATDMILSFFFLLSIFLFSVWMTNNGWIKHLAGLGFFASCALATLTKGPVGLALPVGIVIVYLAIQQKWRDIFRFPWIAGVVLYILIAAPWYVLYTMQVGSEHLGRSIIKENLDRYLHAWNNVEPFYYYFHRFPISFLPWSFFIPAAAVSIWRGLKKGVQKEWNSSLLLPLIWFAIVFIFFSISSGKRTVYLLPIFPAASLLIGWFFDKGTEFIGGARSRFILGSAVALCIVMAIIGISLPFILTRMVDEAALSASIIGIFFAGGSIGLALSVRWNPIPTIARNISFILLIAWFVSSLWLIPVMDSYQNARSLSKRIVGIVPQGAIFATGKKKHETFLFYTGLRGQEITDGEAMKRIMSSGQPAYCLLQEEDWERYQHEQSISGTVLLHASVSTFPYVLVTNGVRNER